MVGRRKNKRPAGRESYRRDASPTFPPASPIPSPVSSTPGSPSPVQDSSSHVRINRRSRIASLKALEPERYLDDIVVNTVIQMLVNRDDRFEAVDTLMINYVSQGAETPHWFRQYHEPLRGRPHVLIPWCYTEHWTLFHYTSSGEVTYYNSMPGHIPLATAESVINRYLDEALGPETPRSRMAIANGPVQYNGYDCGLFVLRYVDTLTNFRVALPVLPSVQEDELRDHYKAVFLRASME
ncbi:hypothetical protein LX36DRAFT_672584 [Colletotrichum falcatum]|nr:hypothetical protein LX36DRAFT_672584 [Colletotrichum falcatum]